MVLSQCRGGVVGMLEIALVMDNTKSKICVPFGHVSPMPSLPTHTFRGACSSGITRGFQHDEAVESTSSEHVKDQLRRYDEP